LRGWRGWGKIEAGPEQGRPKGRESGESPRSARSLDARRERMLRRKKRGFCVNHADFALLLFCFIAIPGQFSARIASIHPSFDAISAMNEGEMAIV
jgi:hypothetical protein